MISGIVTDEMDLPLPNVYIKGITKGQTNFDGKFSIKAEKEMNLFSYIG
jgi:hypothetical protein